MLTLSDSGDSWHLALQIKQLPGWPERKIIFKPKLQSEEYNGGSQGSEDMEGLKIDIKGFCL